MAEHELSWPEIQGAQNYRVLIREEASQAFVADQILAGSSWTVPPDALDGEAHHSWQVLWSSAADGGWRPLLPELPLEPALYPASARTTELSWRDSGADAYRVLIRDNASDGLLLKLPVRGTSYIVDWSRLPAPAHYRWRLQTWDVDAATWQDLDPYMPLPEPARIGSAGPAEGSGPGEPRVLLLFTVDTEATLQYMSDPDPRRAVEEFIFGRHPDGEAGIEMIMDALERHDFKGTFFLDVLCEYQFGEGTLEPVVDAIKRRGHDIQLHMHTAPHLRFARDPELVALSDALASYDADKFRAALELAIGLFVERVGEAPVAYRSGAYRVSDEFLRILPEFGLRIDSSIYAFKNCEVSSWMRARTQPFRVGSLLEIPVSWRLEWRGSGPVPMQFAPYRQGGDENRSFTQLPAPNDGPPSTLVYLGHSYQYRMRGPDIGSEAVTRWRETLEGRLLLPEHSGSYDRTAPPWFFGAPDASRIDLLEQNLRELAARGDVAAPTMREIADGLIDTWDDRAAPIDPVPELRDDGGRSHLTATRVYSHDYLRHLA